MTDLITLRHVEKDYESGAGIVRALCNVNLEIRQGEFVAVVGTSGSGKSTLMNILGCLDRPTRGTYELAGFDVGGRSSDARAILRNRLIGFIFQGFNLLPRTTALENVELPLVYRGVSPGHRRKLATEALDAVGLTGRVHHTPNQLSGGQQQRVAIARALVTGPPMLLADEPTGNLDTRTSLEVLGLLQRLNRERGITIVLVTHEHDIAACASRIVTFRDGQIVSDVLSEAPTDAARELAALPSEDVSKLAHDKDSPDDARTKIGGPVPLMMYIVMALAGIGGVAVGSIYAKNVLDMKTSVPSFVFAFVFEALCAAWYANRRFGRPLTNDQRARISIYYTLAVACIVAPVIALSQAGKPLLDRIEAMPARGGLFVVVCITTFALATVSLARYLVLALVAPLVRPRAKSTT